MEEIWMEIPGFSKYKINRNCELFSVNRNRLITPCKSARHTGCFYHLSHDEGYRHVISAARLGYSAIKSISPVNIPSNYILSFKNGVMNIDNIIVEDRSICASRIRMIRSAHLKPTDEYYDQCIRFCEAARKKDATSLYNIVEENKPEIRRYLDRLFGIRKSEEAYNEIVSYFVAGIIDGQLRCSNAVSYLFTLARKFAKAWSSQESMIEIESRLKALNS